MVNFRNNILLVAAFAAAIIPLHAQDSLQKKVESAISSEKGLAGATVAVCATDSEGVCSVSVNEHISMIPASNMKLISTGLALDALGGDYRFKTVLGYSGSLRDGALDGDLYIIGGADPLLGSRDTIASPVKTVFNSWKALMDKAGICRINGRIIGDGRFVEGTREEQSWLWEDIGTYYGTGMSGLGFAENTLRFRVEAGENPGDSLKIRQLCPMSPWLSVEYDCLTGMKGTGDQLYLFTTDFATEAALRGTFAAGKAEKEVLCSNKYPELTCADEFSRYLSENGLANEGSGYTTGKTGRIWDPENGMSFFEPADSLTLIGSTESAPLKKIARKTNFESNNFCAETLFRMLGKEKEGSADYESSRKASIMALAELGLSGDSRHGLNMVDGSGLSRKNSLTASFLCRFLAAMMDSPSYPDFYASIPTLGSSKAVPADVAGRVRRKTGSMEGVYCLSGYYTDNNGKVIIFSILINNSPVSVYSTRIAAERILAAILLK